jgi:hypothetical protein
MELATKALAVWLGFRLLVLSELEMRSTHENGKC